MEIFLAIISSSVLSAIISSFFAWKASNKMLRSAYLIEDKKELRGLIDWLNKFLFDLNKREHQPIKDHISTINSQLEKMYI